MHTYISTYIYIEKGGSKIFQNGGDPRREDYLIWGDEYPLETVMVVLL